jgi:hypothetical protein
MELAKRDQSIKHLQNIINDKQRSLREKNLSLPKQSKDNIYLREIVGDYSKYFDSEKQKKEKQHNALLSLLEYITQITLDPNSSEEILRECKYDQSLILAELKQLNK